MKNIELTDSHKSKLLEMGKVLFPEWTFITFQESAIMGAGWDYDFNNICFSKKSETLFNIEINIHWFEFCHCHLFEKIYVKPNGYESISDYISMNSNFIIGHPVDYLYEEFLRLK